MSIELSVSSSQGHVAEWHDSILEDGRRKGGMPENCDVALQHLNEHWYGDLLTTDEEKFNEVFEPDVEAFNAKQTRPSRKMGPESTKESRQKSYYKGIVDGTFAFGRGKQKEQPVYEAVLQIGNKDDNGITDSSFEIDKWYELKRSGKIEEASAYAKEHLNQDETAERSKRILKRAVDRIVALDPEHLIVHRADYHGDEPCGTGNVHIAFTFRGTGYDNGMPSRCASVKALEQMGFAKTKDSEYGITQLHERFKEIIEEEMIADALEHGYEPIKRKAPSGEKRQRSDIDVFREMAAEKEALDKRQKEQADTQHTLEVWSDNLLEQSDKLDEQNRKTMKTAKQLQERKAKLDDAAKKLQKWQNHWQRQFFDAGAELLAIVQETDEIADISTIPELVEMMKEAAVNKQKENDKREAEFQVREDALEAQKKVLETREIAVEEREKAVAEIQAQAKSEIALTRDMRAEAFKAKMQYERLFDDASISVSQARTIRQQYQEREQRAWDHFQTIADKEYEDKEEQQSYSFK